VAAPARRPAGAFFAKGTGHMRDTEPAGPIRFVQFPPSERGRTWDIDRIAEEEGPSVIPEKILAAVQQDIGEVNRVYKGSTSSSTSKPASSAPFHTGR